METDVELDEHLSLQPAPAEDARESFCRRDAVEGDGQFDAGGGDVGQPLPLVGAERWVVDEDLRRPSLLEHLRLACLGNGEPVSAELELPSADLGRLVCLRVRPERDPVLVHV